MEKKWIHIALRGSDPWFYPIAVARNRAIAENRVPERSGELDEVVYSLMLRLSLLPRIEERIKTGLGALVEAIGTSKEGHVSIRGKLAPAFIWDEGRLLHLVLDIDSLLFELSSCVDLMKNLLTKAHRETTTPLPSAVAPRKPDPNQRSRSTRRRRNLASKGAGRDDLIRSILQTYGRNTAWIDELESIRDLFIHEAAPYPCVELSSGGADLILLSRTAAYPDDDTGHPPMSKVVGIIRGFQDSRDCLSTHLIGIYDRCI